MWKGKSGPELTMTRMASNVMLPKSMPTVLNFTVQDLVLLIRLWHKLPQTRATPWLSLYNPIPVISSLERPCNRLPHHFQNQMKQMICHFDHV